MFFYVFLVCFLCRIVWFACYSEWLFGYVRVLIRALKGRKGYIKLKNTNMPFNCEECNVIGAKLNNLVEKRLCRDCLISDKYRMICKSDVKNQYNFNNNDFENYPYQIIYTNNPLYKCASSMNLFYEKE